jgi:hypothetical protein
MQHTMRQHWLPTGSLRQQEPCSGHLPTENLLMYPTLDLCRGRKQSLLFGCLALLYTTNTRQPVLAAETHLLAVFTEVDNRCRCMRLHAGLVKVLHDGHEARYDELVLSSLNVGAQICAHLAQRLAGCPPDLGVRVLQTLRKTQTQEIIT